MSLFRILTVATLLASLLPGAVPADEKPAGPAKWEAEIQKFETQDADRPVAPGGIVFVGSSSIRLWKLDQSFPDLPVLNRGFGGSEMDDTAHFAERLVLKHQPRVVVVYAGDNDLAKGKTPEQIAEGFRRFAGTVHERLPHTRIVFIAIKPSPSRWKLADQQRAANQAVCSFCQADCRRVFLDIFTPMLGVDGEPRPGLFVADRLHMNAAGYELWTSLLRPYLTCP